MGQVRDDLEVKCIDWPYLSSQTGLLLENPPLSLPPPPPLLPPPPPLRPLAISRVTLQTHKFG